MMESAFSDGMQKPIRLRLAVLFFGFILISGTECKNAKRATDSNAAVVVAHLEKLAGAIPLTRFELDTVVTQQVDKANTISKYTLVGDTNVLYERNSNDKNKEVIVLSSDEDTIPFATIKKIYVVLKKKPDGDSYFVSLALLRAATDKDTENVLELSGKKLVVEWERFDEHFVNGRPSITFYAVQCSSGFLVPCSFNDTILSASEKASKSPKFVGKMVRVASITDIESKPEVENGSDAMCNADLYYDLDFKQNEGIGAGRSFGEVPTTSKGRGFGGPAPQQPYAADVLYFPSQPPDTGVGILGGILSGVGGLVCGILSILASCADERAHHNAMPIGLAAQEGFNKNTWQIGTVFGRKRRSTDTSVSSFLFPRNKREGSGDLEIALDYPGWKTQFKTPKKDILSESGLFYGFGNCPYKPQDGEGLKKTSNDAEIVDFYLTALRANCIPWMREYVLKLIEAGFLIVKEKGLQANPTFSLYKEPKLGLKETLQLSSAAELDAVSNAILAESSNPTTSPKSPDGKRDISKSINVITKTGIKALERTMEYAHVHTVLLRRHLLQSFKQVLTKLRQDFQNLDRCTDDCGNDKETNRNDRLQVLGLIQFIRFGSGAIKSPSDVPTLYEKFYTKNFNSIEKLVDLYA